MLHKVNDIWSTFFLILPLRKRICEGHQSSNNHKFLAQQVKKIGQIRGVRWMRESAETSNCLVLLVLDFLISPPCRVGWSGPHHLGYMIPYNSTVRTGAGFCKKSSMHYLYAGLDIQEWERYLALIYYDRVVCGIDTLIRVAFPVVLRVVVNGLRLGHFNVFMHSVLGVDGIQLRLGEVMDDPSPKRITHNVDWSSHPVPRDEAKKFSEELLFLWT